MITNPPQQRSLRGHRPARPTPRLAASGAHLARLAGNLTPRDRWLARMLYTYRVFTTHQIVQLAWPTARAANLRLLQLFKWRVIDRFQPFITTGSAPMHYVLDVAGAAILAREDGLEPNALAYRHDRAIGIAHSLRLAHTVGTNSLFTSLVHRARQSASTEQLTAWWPETRCAQHFGDIVRPDGYGRWHDRNTGSIEWFVEYDAGTEPLAKLAGKLLDYHRLALTSGITTPVLIWLPTARREANARTALAGMQASLEDPALVPVATTSADYVPGSQKDFASARWLPLESRRIAVRLPLAELGHVWTHLPPLPHSSHTPAAQGTTGLRPPSPHPPTT
ncbi:replication-relaxation family protein [Streptomyces sp. NPDC127098]|uniref:replication-relaxation family protein n=1 Tax=Streptomyces sp. NPDC127098 TaxID=3347137 RepID=UPI00364E8FBD